MPDTFDLQKEWESETKEYRKTTEEISLEMNVDPRTVRKWRKNGVPPYRVLEWCEVTGEKPTEVNPRLYPIQLFRGNE